MSLANKEISELYVALFGRAPDLEGFNFWKGLLASGRTTAQIADDMFATAPARFFFHEGATDGQIIASFYYNVLGRQPDGEGWGFWMDKLAVPGATRGAVLAELVSTVSNYNGTDPAGLASAALFNNRVAAAQYYAEHRGTIDRAGYVLEDVTTEAASVLAARTLIAQSGGTMSAGGFGEIVITSMYNDLTVYDLMPDATLTLGDSTGWLGNINSLLLHTVRVELADATGTDDTVRLRFAANDLADAARIELPGVEHLEVVDPNVLTVYDHDHLYLVNSAFKTLTASGPGMLTIEDANAGDIDGSGMLKGIHVWRTAGTKTVKGGPAADTLNVRTEGAVVNAGGGDDYIISDVGKVSMRGGSGHDSFWLGQGTSRASYTTILDFTVGTDELYLAKLVTYNAGNFGNWRTAPVSGSSFTAGLDAAASIRKAGDTKSPISWFNQGGNTYIVVDNSMASKFQDGIDQFVKFVGTLDLSTLSLGETSFFMS